MQILFSIDDTDNLESPGRATFAAYSDSTGATALPAGFSLAIAANGNLGNGADASLLGKLAYFKEMFVLTKTDPSGAYSLSIGLKR